MQNKIKKQDGYSLIELIMVMALLVIFGISIFTLVLSGSKTYERINANKDIENNARIINSAINIRIKQYDKKDMVRIEEKNISDKKVQMLTLEEEIPGNNQNLITYIYWFDDNLWECLAYKNEEPSLETSMSLLESKGFDVEFKQATNAIKHYIKYDYSGEEKVLTSTTYLRSH